MQRIEDTPAYCKRYRSGVCGGLAGGAVGLVIAWVIPIVGISQVNGLDGETMMWARDASEVWQLWTVVGGAVIGGLVSVIDGSPRANFFCLPWVLLGSWLGMHIGEMSRMEAEGRDAIGWNPWPGGIGITTGAFAGFILWRVCVALMRVRANN